MLTLEQLQVKYPKFSVKQIPIPDCAVCRGEGEFVNGQGHLHICACVCLGGPDKLRKVMVDVLQGTVEGLIGDLKTGIEREKP